jgi:hypothetical protein
MQNAKQDTRRITTTGMRAPKNMSIAQYVDLVDRLLEKEDFTPLVKKPPQPVR